MLELGWSCLLFILAGVPAVLTFRNLRVFHRLPQRGRQDTLSAISVLIPARNESATIRATLESVLASATSQVQVVVMDDDSSDNTAEIVETIVIADPRVTLKRSAPLPAGWNGKQHACWQLANYAKHDLLVFLDADVILQDSALARLQVVFNRSNVALHSGFPAQEMRSVGERLLLPMMYVLLLGFLPLDRMRRTTKPEFGAGCGQLFITRRREYFAVGGHASIRASRHDGLTLPRAFRRCGYGTDVFDASDIAGCRMYSSSLETVWGLMKNASEGMANSRLIGVFTVLLAGAAVLPVLTLGHACFWNWSLTCRLILVAATTLSFLPRVLIAKRFERSLAFAILYPLGVTIFLAIQWAAFIVELQGKRADWKGRSS
ncbi:MAG: glycosyltransferase [Planctomycetales bacterium]|nr:glycosyltransferase [Planctomycetales bacterium]